MNITISSITTPTFTLPLWEAILIGYVVANFIMWQFFIWWRGYDLIANGSNIWSERLNPLQLLFAWVSILFYILF
jgi:hypothetical protein